GVVEAEHRRVAADRAEEAVQLLERLRPVGLDVAEPEVDEVAEQRLVVLRRQLVAPRAAASLLELAGAEIDVDLHDLAGRQAHLAHRPSPYRARCEAVERRVAGEVDPLAVGDHRAVLAVAEAPDELARAG